MPSRIFIIEDHPLMRDMLAELIEDEVDLQVCGIASSGEDALAAIDALDAQLLLVDVSLPRMNGLEFVAAVHEKWPAMPCVMLSGHAEQSYVTRALESGANGFVVKGNPDEIVEAIRSVLRGETYLSKTLLRGDAPSPGGEGRPDYR